MYPTTRKFAGQVYDSHGFEVTIEEFPEGIKTTDDAAVAVGCDTAQIVKSIVMRVDNETVVVLTGSANRVDEASLGSEFDAEQGSVWSANPSKMKVAIGWNTGGVPPTCYTTSRPILVGPTFEPLDRIWIVAGIPEVMLQLTPGDPRAFSAPQFTDVFEWGERRIKMDTRYGPPRTMTRATPPYPLSWSVGAKWVSLERNSEAIIEPLLVVRRDKLSFRRKWLLNVTFASKLIHALAGVVLSDVGFLVLPVSRFDQHDVAFVDPRTVLYAAGSAVHAVLSVFTAGSDAVAAVVLCDDYEQLIVAGHSKVSTSLISAHILVWERRRITYRILVIANVTALKRSDCSFEHHVVHCLPTDWPSKEGGMS